MRECMGVPEANLRCQEEFDTYLERTTLADAHSRGYFMCNNCGGRLLDVTRFSDYKNADSEIPPLQVLAFQTAFNYNLLASALNNKQVSPGICQGAILRLQDCSEIAERSLSRSCALSTSVESHRRSRIRYRYSYDFMRAMPVEWQIDQHLRFPSVVRTENDVYNIQPSTFVLHFHFDITGITGGGYEQYGIQNVRKALRKMPDGYLSELRYIKFEKFVITEDDAVNLLRLLGPTHNLEEISLHLSNMHDPALRLINTSIRERQESQT